jgi:hypothetical protein
MVELVINEELGTIAKLSLSPIAAITFIIVTFVAFYFSRCDGIGCFQILWAKSMNMCRSLLAMEAFASIEEQDDFLILILGDCDLALDDSFRLLTL